MKKIIIPTVAFLFVLSVFLFIASQRKKLFTDSRILMDTIVAVNVVSNSKSVAETAMEEAFSAIEKIGLLINMYSEKSELSLINKNAGKKPVRVSPETLDVIRQSVTIAERTGGAFDPTIGAVTALWDFGKKVKPDGKDIRGLLKLVSYKNIEINDEEGTVFLKKKGMRLDLGGIAKGYAADKAVEVLSAAGIKSALVSVAGDIRGYGGKPEGDPWRIGIQDPRPTSPTDNILAALPLQDRAISTSGDYQRFFELEGIRYHHLLNPATGMPASGCRSVSVVADSAVITDALSTAVFVLGPNKGLQLLKDLGYEGLLEDAEGKIYITEGLKQSIEVKRSNR